MSLIPKTPFLGTKNSNKAHVGNTAPGAYVEANNHTFACQTKYPSLSVVSSSR